MQKLGQYWMQINSPLLATAVSSHSPMTTMYMDSSLLATSCATTFTARLGVDAEQPQCRFFIGLGPVTGQLVAHMIHGEKSSLDVTPFRIARH